MRAGRGEGPGPRFGILLQHAGGDRPGACGAEAGALAGRQLGDLLDRVDRKALRIERAFGRGRRRDDTRSGEDGREGPVAPGRAVRHPDRAVRHGAP